MLRTVENIVEQYPDSALNLLDSIKSPLYLKESQYYKYILLSVQARDKNYQDISSDTLIFRTAEYFVNKADMKNAALASFYSGRVLQEIEGNEKAMFAYLDAESYADKFDGEYNLKGLIQTSIGYLFFNQLLYDQALLHIKEAREYFRLSHNLKNEVSLLRHIRDSFLLTEDNKQDSAFSYYHKSLDLANLSQNPTLQISVCLNLGVAYRESGEYKKAKDYLNQAIGLTEDNENQANLYFNLAQVFYSENKNDSTIYYLDKSIILLNENKDTYLTSSFYLFLSVLQEELGNGDVYVCDHFVYPEYKLGNIYSSSLI